MESRPNLEIARLKKLESQVDYWKSPPRGLDSFVCAARKSAVIISAPHGTRTLRDVEKVVWHEEDEYTAGFALLLAKECGTSVIANVWRSDSCDPNIHDESRCIYKQQLRQIVRQQGVRWLLDLHGAAENNKAMGAHRVDLGTRKDRNSMDPQHRDKLCELIELGLGHDSVSINRIPALYPGRVTAFCQDHLGIQAVQIEMKPSVRVPLRRTDSSTYAKSGPFSARADDVLAMLSALKDFVQYLENLGNSD